MERIPHIKLSEYFRSMKPAYVLGTTYTVSLMFFESVIFPLIDKANLKRCLILCDRTGFKRTIIESTALRAVTSSYMIATAPSDYSFHPKVWLMVNDEELSLLVGSGNLTQSGFIDNQEYFDGVTISIANGNKTIVDDIGVFLRGLKNLWVGPHGETLLVHETLSLISEAVNKIQNTLKTEDRNTRFLTSFHGPLQEELEKYVDGCKLHIASPYFGGSAGGIQLLQKAVKATITKVFPAIHKDQTIDVDLKSLQSMTKTDVVSIKYANKNRFSHFKLYGFHNSKGNSYIFAGSHNCTLAAIGSKNIEAGILRKTSLADIKQYFEEVGLPQNLTLRKENYEGTSNWLEVLASNEGSYILAHVHTKSAKKLPLHKVNITIRIGSRRLSYKTVTLFKDGDRANLYWSSFEGVKPKMGEVCLLELSATDDEGKPVAGACFIDDRAVLSSGPERRSIIRILHALQDDDILPDYYDFAAVFNLMDGVLELPLDVSGSEELHQTSTLKGKNDKNDVDRIPIWPPIAADHPAAQHNTLGLGGDIYWFQKILMSLITISKEDPESTTSEQEIEDEGDEGKNRKSPKEEIKPSIVTRKSEVEKAWKHVQTDYDYLMDKLESLVITDRNANKIWPITVGWLLWTMKLRKAIVFKLPDDNQIPSTSGLISKYVYHVFADRMQGADYASPKDCRYKGNQFPNIAEDLTAFFNIKPGKDLLQILFALFVYLKIKAHSVITGKDTFPINSWLMYLEIVGDHRDDLFSCVEPTELIIKRYLIEKNDNLSSGVIVKAMDELSSITWKSHPGYRDVEALYKIYSSEDQLAAIENCQSCVSEHIRSNLKMCKIRLDSGKQIFHSLGKASECCTVSGCPKGFVVDPTKQKLKYNLPVICDGCGSVLVPEKLFKIYQKDHNVNLP